LADAATTGGAGYLLGTQVIFSTQCYLNSKNHRICPCYICSTKTCTFSFNNPLYLCSSVEFVLNRKITIQSRYQYKVVSGGATQVILLASGDIDRYISMGLFPLNIYLRVLPRYPIKYLGNKLPRRGSPSYNV